MYFVLLNYIFISRCFTETFLTPDIQLTGDDLLTPAMSCLRADRPPSRNARGGVMICADERLHPFATESVMDGLEGVSMSLLWQGDSFNLVVLYNRPNAKISSTTLALEKLVSSLYVQNPTIILGDMNMDLKKDTKVTDFLQRFGFKQLVKVPTTDYGSILDHVYVNFDRFFHIDVTDCYYSDHDKVILCFH